MQRLFGTFPDAAPGAGLVLLRVSVGVGLVWASAGATPTAAAPVAIVVGFALLAGAFTPLSSLAACAFAAILLVSGGVPDAALISLALDAAALGLLGPGAYSVDAVRFGRRVL